MATYFVNTSKFKPFEFELMVQPVLAAQEAHVDLENLLGDLRLKASVWDNLANEQLDPEAFKMYQTYANDLRSLAEALSSQGLTPQSRSGLMSMRERYGSEIVPIESAYLRRAEQAKQLQEMMAKDLNIRFDRMASATSLDDYIRNPELAYRGVSGTVLANQVAAASDGLAKLIRENPDKYKRILGGQYFEIISLKGFSAEEVNAAINGDPNANPLLTQVVNDVMSSAGVDKFDPAVQLELRTIASQGLYKSIGGEESKYMDNWMMKLQAQEALVRGRKSGSGENDPDGLGKDKRPYTPIPRTSALRNIVNSYGGKKLQGTLDVLNEIGTSNKFGITDLDILDRRQLKQQQAAISSGNTSGPASSRMTFGSASAGGLTWDPGVKFKTGSPKDQAIDTLIDAMDTYGVDNLELLGRATYLAKEMTAMVNNDYQFEVTDDELAIDKILKRLSSFGDGALREIKNNKAQGTSLDKKKIEELILSKDTKTIVFDTKLDEMTLSIGGKRYIINSRLVSPQLESDIELLKLMNPDNTVSIKDENNRSKPFSRYYLEYANAYSGYDKTMKEVLRSYNAWFNQFAKKQGTSETVKEAQEVE